MAGVAHVLRLRRRRGGDPMSCLHARRSAHDRRRSAGRSPPANSGSTCPTSSITWSRPRRSISPPPTGSRRGTRARAGAPSSTTRMAATGAGRSRIYELIFNTRPIHAFLMDGNSLVAQTLVIAHCLGHGYVFENNAWLGAVDREIMSRVGSAADRIADYMGALRARPGRGLPRRVPRDRRPPAPGTADPQGERPGADAAARPVRRAVPVRGRRRTRAGRELSAWRCDVASRESRSRTCSGSSRRTATGSRTGSTT